MKTVIIPSDYHPFVIEVNGIKYTYPEGTEQSVPDEVAGAIEHYYKLQPQEKPTDGGVLPYVSGENNGEVLTVKDGAWTSANGGLSESDFVMNGNDLAGFNTDEGKIYLPVFPDTGYWLEKIGDGGIALKRNTDLYVPSEATGSQHSRQAIAYEHKGVRYVLSAAMVGSLILSGAAEESINIPAGAPTKLWDSVIVAVGSAELYCRRLSPESATTAAYQGFVSSENDFGEGIFRLDMGVEKSGTSTYTFSLSFKKASGSGGGVENGYVVIDITSGSAGSITSVKFNDVEKGANWLKDSQTAVILSISQVVIKISNDQYDIYANWVNHGTYLSGTGTYALNTPDGDEFGLCEINFVFENDEITANFIQLLST